MFSRAHVSSFSSVWAQHVGESNRRVVTSRVAVRNVFIVVIIFLAIFFAQSRSSVQLCRKLEGKMGNGADRQIPHNAFYYDFGSSCLLTYGIDPSHPRPISTHKHNFLNFAFEQSFDWRGARRDHLGR